MANRKPKGRCLTESTSKPQLPMDPQRIQGYHAHVYYDPATKPVAQRLRETVGARFAIRLGSWHDAPVGPHPVSMYQILFATEELPRLLPFLMLNREGLSILVHPVTGDDYRDHADFPLWLGSPLPLLLESLR
jgi:aromatic ring-cleaving dioxygenase